MPQIARAPPSLNRLIGKMMAKSAAGRHANYDELMIDLVRLDRSGLLRDEVLEAGIPGSADQIGPAAGRDVAPQVADRNVPAARFPPAGGPGLRPSDIPTQVADDEAVILSQLDSDMKRVPGSSTGGATPSSGSRGHSTRKAGAGMLELDTQREGGGALRRTMAAVRGIGLGEGEDRKLPGRRHGEGEDSTIRRYGIYGAIGGAALLVLLVLVFARGGGEEISDEERRARAEIANLESVLKRKSATAGARRVAVRNLADYKHPGAEMLLIHTLADPSPIVRAEAVKSLAVVCGVRAVTMVHARLEDDSPDVREVAARTLERLTEQDLSGIDWRKDAEALRRTAATDFLKQWRER